MESSQKDKKFNIYNFQPDRAEDELVRCFGIVLNRIKEKIIINRNNILEAVKLGVTEPIKPVEIQQEPAVPAPTESAPEVKAEEETVAETTVEVPAGEAVQTQQ